MIYTKMMDSLNEEEIPQEAAVEQPVEPAADIEEVTVEEVEDFNDGLVEGAKIDSEIKVESMKFDKSFSILSHVRKYGVDRSFLNICNSDNRLATDLGIVLPASEDFEIYGSPNSNVSKRVIAAMESGDSLWSRFWEWIKGIASKLWNWVKSFFVKAWEFIKKLLGIGTSKLEKISDITQALKKQGVRTIEVNEDFMNLNDRLKDSILERQDKMIRRREFLNGIKGLVENSYKCIKDLMSKKNIEKRTEDLESLTRKLKEYSGNVWDVTKTAASEGSNAVGRIGNFLGDVWDSAVDSVTTSNYAINRYRGKAVREQAHREYRDARKRGNDELSDWLGSTYENVAKDGTFNNDTRFTYRPQPWTPNLHPIFGGSNNNNRNTQQSTPNNNRNAQAQAAPVRPTTSAAQAAPVTPAPAAANNAQPNVNNNNRNAQARQAPVVPAASGAPAQARVTPAAPNSNNAQNTTIPPLAQQTSMNHFETHIRSIIRSWQRIEDENQMQDRIQRELTTMMSNFTDIANNLNRQNAPTDDVSRSVRDSVVGVMTILNNISHDFGEATRDRAAVTKDTLAVYDDQLSTLSRFINNGVNATSTLLYDRVLRLSVADVAVADVSHATFDPTSFVNIHAGSTTPFDINRLVRPSYGTVRNNNFIPSAWDIHVPVGVGGAGSQQVTHLIVHCRLDVVIGRGGSESDYYYAFGNRNAAVRIHYYIPDGTMNNQPVSGTSLQLGSIGGSPTQTTVRFV